MSCGYGDRLVLDCVSLTVTRGERVALIGANGVGKSTLLKVIGGLLRPRAGSVRIGGKDVGEMPREQLGKVVAMVPQELVVSFSFTVQEMVELGRTAYLGLFGVPTAADRAAVSHAIEATDSASLAPRVFNELSGGERQRVLVAMALAQEPSLLLVDEPTQRLDLTRQSEILDLIKEVSDGKGLTVLAAIHDLNLAAMYFDRLVVLENGAVLADGAPENVVRRDILERAFAGRLRFLSVPESPTPIVLPQSRLERSS